jgi:MFS family permease
MPRIFPKLTATRLQATTYLLGIALFSISFLVFLNSSISFVVTDIIGQKKGVGDAVGTLSFADELLALVACPLWGLISDRVGVKPVAVLGYCVIGVSLIGLVKSDNVYPELLAGRLVFSIGAAACTTMVTAVLPAMVVDRISREDEPNLQEHGLANGHARRLLAEERQGRRDSIGHGASPSVSSELTITQTTYATDSQTRQQQGGTAGEQVEVEAEDKTAGTSQLAGFVGLFTGAGALVALLIFLPIPAYFQKRGQSPADSLETSYYIVSTIAFCVAIFVFIGLRNLPGEEEKSISALFQQPYDERTDLSQSGHLHTTLTPAPSYVTLVKDALKLGLTDSNIFLGYVGGFVARASSVAISLFIPMFVNTYFIRTGLCKSNPGNLPDIKKNCEDAYILAAALSGIAETAALIWAPIFGWLGGKALRGSSEWPLLVAAIVGVGGYTAFGLLRNPDAFHEHEEEGGQWAIIAVILIGVSQIGSIVCSLGLLGWGINTKDAKDGSKDDGRPGTSSTLRVEETGPAAEGPETAPLLPRARKRDKTQSIDRSRLKGSIAGIYSFAGGAGILLLTKLGGALFDSWSPGAPFFIMAIFNGILFVAVVAVVGGRAVRRRIRGNQRA